MSSGSFKINCLGFCNESSDDEHKHYDTTIKQQTIAQQQINKYKKIISRLQNENNLAKQREMIFKDLLATNKRKFEERLDAIRHQFKQNEELQKVAHSEQLNKLNEQIKTKDYKLKQLEQRIDAVQKHFDERTLKCNNNMKSLNNEIRHKDMRINQLEKDNKDFIVICKQDNKEITELKNQIQIKNAEIHSLQMLTHVTSYDIDIATPCNYQRKRSSHSAIRKMSILSDLNCINVPLYVEQRSNNGSISISSPSTDSPYSVYSNNFDPIKELMECKSNQRDVRAQTC